MDIENLFSVRGKTALVTGGTSGIGYMIVEGLVRAGVKVYTCARDVQALAKTQAALGPLGELRSFAGDIGSGEGVAAICNEYAKHESKLHILVNNVGATHRAPFEEFSREEFDRVIDVNLASPFDMTRRMTPALRAAASESDPARVINISSIGAMKLMNDVNNFAYSSSKAGLILLTRHIAAELVKDHITVNTIAPGLFESRLAAYMFDPSHPQYHTRPTIPIDRPGMIEDITGGVIYLASRAGAFVTGAMIPVAGGQGTADWA